MRVASLIHTIVWDKWFKGRSRRFILDTTFAVKLYNLYECSCSFSIICDSIIIFKIRVIQHGDLSENENSPVIQRVIKSYTKWVMGTSYKRISHVCEVVIILICVYYTNSLIYWYWARCLKIYYIVKKRMCNVCVEYWYWTRCLQIY